MISQTLWQARQYEEVAEKNIKPEERPVFHLSPRSGWMNDPNGLSLYQGRYHLFYQYYPYASRWGLMHWGHAVSDDLLHWEYLPAALAPDHLYDGGGCFSGSAVQLSDGRQLLMYTGVQRLSSPMDEQGKCLQTQCIAVGDGVNYQKYGANPVLDSDDLPEGASPFDFRDPRLWQEADGTYSCVVASRSADGSGALLLFTSPDALHWTFRSVLAANCGRFGKMWECPDFFQLDGKDVILVSPQDMLPQGHEYSGGNGTLCLIGKFDRERGTFAEESDQAIDYGIDFYAPQTILTPDGRRVMIGWMQNWDSCPPVGNERKWTGQMTLPRELFLKDGRLYQRPIRELDALRQDRLEYRDIRVADGEITLEGVSGRTVDLELEIRAADPAHMYRKFALRFAKDDTLRTGLSFRPYESVLKIDRKFSGTRRAFVHHRRAKVGGKDGTLRLRLILDRFSAEVFVNGGEKVMTVTIDTPQSADSISFFADGAVSMNLVKYDLREGDEHV